MSESPDVLLLGLAECRPSWGPLHGNIVSSLLSKFLGFSLADSLPVFKRLWSCNSAVLVQGFVEMYRANVHVDCIRRILEIIHDLGSNALLEVLATKQNYFFVCDLAVVSAHNHSIPLANWMSKAIADGGDEFALACVSFLRERFYSFSPPRPGLPTVSSEMAASMVQSLQAGKFSNAVGEVRKLTKDAQGRLVGGAPPMQNISMPNNPPPAINLANPVNNGIGGQGNEGQDVVSQQVAQQSQTLFPPDIEEEANSHFQRIYTSEMQIDGVIQMLKGFKLSPNQREQEVFACMIHNLFDEYRFFPR
jgi:CCR4-NOT transcription complex subunit 1